MEQALAFRPEQLHLLPPGVWDSISDMVNYTWPSRPPVGGNWSDYDDDYNSTNMHPPPHTHDGATVSQLDNFTQESVSPAAGHPRPGTENPNDEVVPPRSGVTVPGSVESDGNQNTANYNNIQLSGNLSATFTSPSSDDDDDSSNDNDRQHDGTSHQLPEPGPGTGGDSFDPFRDLSRIQDAIDAVPDSITSENVNQFLGVLAHIPAADIASRLAPSAVS